MFTERLLDTGELRVRVLTGPEHGPPVLFLHGVSRSGRDFVPLFPALAGSWQLHTLDHRGHGGSDRAPRRAYRITDYARDAAAVVRALGRPVVLFGHSLGAVTAAAVAAAEPGLVRAAVLEDPPSAEPVRLGEVRDAAALRLSARCLPQLDRSVFDPVLDGTWFRGYDEDAVWKAIRCPVLLLRGEEARGGMFPAADANRMAAAVADLCRVDVPGVGHMIHWLATEACVRLTLGFLESL